MTDELLRCAEILAQYQYHGTPRSTFGSNVALTYHANQRAIHASGYHGHRVKWHPSYPILTLFDEGTWRTTDGTILHDFGKGNILWHTNGQWCVHDQSYTNQLRWFDFATQIVHHQQGFFIDPTSFHPLDASLIVYKHGMALWNPFSSALRQFDHESPLRCGYAQWSPDGQLIAQIFQDKTHLHMRLYTKEAILVLSHVLNMPKVSDYLLESGFTWSLDSTTVIIHTIHQILWWSILDNHVDVLAFGDHEDIGFRGVLHHPCLPYIAVAGTRTVQIFNDQGIPQQTLSVDDQTTLATIAWHPISPLVIGGTWGCNLIMWTVEGEIIAQRNILNDTTAIPSKGIQCPYYLGFHPLGEWLAVSTKGYYIHIYQLKSG